MDRHRFVSPVGAGPGAFESVDRESVAQSGAASLVVLVCTLALITALAWGAGRISKYTQGQAATGTREDVTVT